MSLSARAKRLLEIATGSKKIGDEIQAAADAGTNPVAGTVAALGSTTNLPASNAVLSTSNTYADAAVKTAIDGAVDALRVPAEARLDAAEAKIDAVIAALKASGQMA